VNKDSLVFERKKEKILEARLGLLWGGKEGYGFGLEESVGVLAAWVEGGSGSQV